MRAAVAPAADVRLGEVTRRLGLAEALLDLLINELDESIVLF